MMLRRILLIVLAGIFGTLDYASAESGGKVPVKVFADGANYCVHELIFDDDKSFGAEQEDTIIRVKALNSSIEKFGAWLLYYDWNNEKSAEVLFNDSCDQIDVSVEDYKSNFLAEVQVFVAGFTASNSSPRVMFESDHLKLRDIGDSFNLQTKYTLDQCTVRIDLKDQDREHSDKVKEIYEITRAIVDGRVNFAFPILFENTMNHFSAYVLFWEHCDVKIDLMEKILLNLERDDPSIDFSNTLIHEERNLEDIKRAFYID